MEKLYVSLCSLLRPKQPKRFRVVHYSGVYWVVQYRWLGLVWVDATRFSEHSGRRTCPCIDSRYQCESQALSFCSSPGAFALHQRKQDRKWRDSLSKDGPVMIYAVYRPDDEQEDG